MSILHNWVIGIDHPVCKHHAKKREIFTFWCGERHRVIHVGAPDMLCLQLL